MPRGRLRASLQLIAETIAEDGCRNFEVIAADVDKSDRDNHTVSLIIESPDLPEVPEGASPPEVRCIITRAMQTAKVEPE